MPTEAEWDTLQNYLIANGYNWDGTTTENLIAKAMASKTDWWNSIFMSAIGCNLTKNNTSGFSALPGGYRVSTGEFNGFGKWGFWLSVTEYSAGSYVRGLSYDFGSLGTFDSIKGNGSSVRLLRD